MALGVFIGLCFIAIAIRDAGVRISEALTSPAASTHTDERMG